MAILSKNCAWWLMSDLAIWMAGYVSVPLYPTLAHDTVNQILTHSEARACFIGKLDGWEGMSRWTPLPPTCSGPAPKLAKSRCTAPHSCSATTRNPSKPASPSPPTLGCEHAAN